jgi:16S rRNA (cytosine967-C5)-methyltransferase
MELMYGVLRNLNRLDYILTQFLANPDKKIDPWLKHNLRLGIYQVIYMDRIPDWAVVDEAVKLAKRYCPMETHHFVNGLLRNVIRNKSAIRLPDMKDNPLQHLALLTTHPEWLIKRWLAQMPLNEVIALTQANNAIPSLTLRVNTLKIDRTSALNELKLKAIDAKPTEFSPDGIEILGEGTFQSLSRRLKLFFQPQDQASQLIAYMLDVKPGQRTLDACAAPGGKCTHLAQLMDNQGEIIAVDVSKKRVESLQDNIARLGIRMIKTIEGDILEQTFQRPFDRILVDAPCSGFGVIRRNPDIKWKRTEEELAQFQALQLKLLEHVKQFLKRDGVMVYSVCSIDRAEGDEVVERFLENNRDFCINSRPLPFALEAFDNNAIFKTLPHRHRMDGFYGVRLCYRH